MENGTGKISCAQAREMDIVDYLAGLGYQPARIRGNDFWYLSPLRNEKTPSFKVDRRINRWYDFGEGCGGNLIDFAIRYNSCTVGEFLASLSGSAFSFHKPERFNLHKEAAERGITIIGERSLIAYPLLNYLKERRIPVPIADIFCREVTYRLKDRQREYFAIGFKNDAGGFELRNPYFKGSVAPKAVTYLKNEGEILCVFEGFIDYLSFLAILQQSGIENRYDYLILNSLAFLEKSTPLLESYPSVYLFLDNDDAGRKWTALTCAMDARYEDKSSFYKKHKDLNEWLCHPGTLPQELTHTLKPP